MSAVERGRNWMVGLSALLVIPHLLVFFLAKERLGPEGPLMPTIRLVVTILLCTLLIKGFAVTRTFLAFALIVGGALNLLTAGITGTREGMLAAWLYGLPFLIAGTVLWRSKAIRAYVEERTRLREAALAAARGK